MQSKRLRVCIEHACRIRASSRIEGALGLIVKAPCSMSLNAQGRQLLCSASSTQTTRISLNMWLMPRIVHRETPAHAAINGAQFAVESLLGGVERHASE